ncbi:MAG: SDR family oxidoreductase [Planctomycetes bacterium]|nr:SDR family oxidoreductase [Planctomycetota bacterium]
MVAREKKTVLVSGASTGIGRATVQRLAARGHRVFAGVRREEDAESIRKEASELNGGGKLEPVQLDVTSESDIDAVAERLEADGVLLDGLVNNAGIVVASPLEALPLEELKRQFEVNLFSHAAVTQALLPSLRAARGRIINMSSIAGRISNPFMGAYCSSKFALEAYSDALRMELAPWGVRVSLIEPGPIKTPIWEKSNRAAAALQGEISSEKLALYREGIERMKEVAEFSVRTAPEASKVARCVSHALESPFARRRYPVGHLIWLQLYAGLLAPAALRDWLTGLVLRWPAGSKR